MNDCLWFRMGFCIDHPGHPCGDGCKRYMSMNCAEGRILLRNYKIDVEDALEPVKRKWRVIYDLQVGEGEE